MRIAYILPSLAKKGPIIVVKDIVDNLVSSNRIKEIIIFYFDDILEVDFPCRTKRISFKEKINFDDFDIIHSHMLRPDLYLFKNKLLGNINKSKLITTLHQYNYINLQYDFGNKWKAYLVSKIWNFSLCKHDLIITLSQDMKKYYQRELFCKNLDIDFIYNGRPNYISQNINNEQLQELDNFDNIVVGTACLLTKRKGLEQVIKIMPDIKNLYFIILGSGPEEENLKKLAFNLDVSERCIFLGFQSRPLDYYKYLDIFILPSRGEGFPLALLEAASMKKAIVSSKLEVCIEAFPNDEILFFELDNLDDLKNKILTTYETRQILENKVYDKFNSTYTAKIMSIKYFENYRKKINETN